MDLKDFMKKLTKDINDFDKIGIEIGKNLKEKSKGNYKKINAYTFNKAIRRLLQI